MDIGGISALFKYILIIRITESVLRLRRLLTAFCPNERFSADPRLKTSARTDSMPWGYRYRLAASFRVQTSVQGSKNGFSNGQFVFAMKLEPVGLPIKSEMAFRRFKSTFELFNHGHL